LKKERDLEDVHLFKEGRESGGSESDALNLTNLQFSEHIHLIAQYPARIEPKPDRISRLFHDFGVDGVEGLHPGTSLRSQGAQFDQGTLFFPRGELGQK
jgi:hypothetical protein